MLIYYSTGFSTIIFRHYAKQTLNTYLYEHKQKVNIILEANHSGGEKL